MFDFILFYFIDFSNVIIKMHHHQSLFSFSLINLAVHVDANKCERFFIV